MANKAYEASKAFVGEHFGELNELCVNDMFGNSAYDLYGMLYDEAPDPDSDAYWHRLNHICDCVLDCMLVRGYEFEPEELALRCIDSFKWHEGGAYFQSEGNACVIVYAKNGEWVAYERQDVWMTHEGRGDTPQQALTNMRMLAE